MDKSKAIVLLSGGLDSATTLAIALKAGYECLALSFQYRQRHGCEIVCAEKVAGAFGVRHKIVNIDLGQFGGSALTDNSIDVPKQREQLGEDEQQIPITYVPARNTIFLSYALAYAEINGAFDLFIGVNSADYSGYPDCRAEYIAAFEKMANLATAAAVEGKGKYTIHTPILHMTKGQIISRGLSLGVNYGLTHSCYDPDPAGRSCGACDSCRLRLKGFAEASVRDPVEYVE